MTQVDRLYDEMNSTAGVRTHYRAFAEWLNKTTAERLTRKRAEADLRTQLVQRDKATAQLSSEVITAVGALAASRKLVDRMRGGLLDRAQRARDLTRIQYEKGAARLIELLDAQRAFAQVRAEYLQDLHDLWLNLFKLEAAVGKELRS